MTDVPSKREGLQASVQLTPTDDAKAKTEKLKAQVALQPHFNAAVIVDAFTSNTLGKVEPNCVIEVIGKACGIAISGDTANMEAMLVSQAHSLDVLFASLARRAGANLSEDHLPAADACMKLALRAQSQCRATLETLATIKNPPVVFAKQANIANGPQQVNNGTMPNPARAETGNTQNEKLEVVDGEWMDACPPGAAVGGDPAVEAVGAHHRA